MDKDTSAGIANADITNARLPGKEGLYALRIREGRLAEVRSLGDAGEEDAGAIDVSGDWVSLGGIDIQINGALGVAFPDLQVGDRETMLDIARFLWQQGIDGFLPTIVTAAVAQVQTALAALASFQAEIQQQPDAAKLLGVHLEGPFLNPDKRGAHPLEHLLPLTVENMQHLLGEYEDLVQVMTLAPELDPEGKSIDYLRDRGIIVSLGHSLATSAEANRAFERGATMVTHAFNAMPGLHHREPGLLGAAIAHPQVRCGLIADGVHVCPTMVQILLRASAGAQGIFLVSDALAPLGLPDGMYPWDRRQMQVTHGTARLEDGTLAGTTLPLLVGASNLVTWGVCTPEEAIALATTAPRRALCLPDLEVGQQVGQQVGQPANLLRWHLNPETNRLDWQRITIKPPVGVR